MGRCSTKEKVILFESGMRAGKRPFGAEGESVAGRREGGREGEGRKDGGSDGVKRARADL